MCVSIPTKIESVFAGPIPTAKLAGMERPYSLIYHPGAQVGDWVLGQNGFVIEVLDEESAIASLEAFRELGYR
ncbi:MAG: HypC/HybG/HupF family hydrogenase formation chaperone [Propionibacteriaceae bacterium]|jgi:hydrogenase expression/formation protein HypC|nr:HypC/HybG/HupF family hydrogenase formation chaperone [Propionibacteriaceae bacterium]